MIRIFQSSVRPLVSVLLFLIFTASMPPGEGVFGATTKGPFADLLGSWSGSGQVKYTDGTSERMSCRGSYTGNGFRMKMALRCFGSGKQVSINGQMRSTHGRVAGSWQENTFSLNGQLNGSASKGRVKLSISGGVAGNMSVSFNRASQSVTVRASGVSLQKVTVRMRRSR